MDVVSALTGLAIIAKSLVICTNAPIIFDICTRLTIYFQQFMGFRYNFLKNSDISGTSYQKGDIQSQGIRILRGGNIQNDKLVLYDDDVYLSEQYFDAEKSVQLGDTLLVASTGSSTVIGKPALITETLSQTQIGAFLRIVRPYHFNISSFFQLLFTTPYYREYIRLKAKGTNINNIKSEYIEQMVVPLPPLSEQHRICAKIHDTFELLR